MLQSKDYNLHFSSPESTDDTAFAQKNQRKL